MDCDPRSYNVMDAHAHFLSHGFYRALLERLPGTGSLTDEEVTARVEAAGLAPPPVDDLELAARWVRELDDHGVQQMVLIATVPEDWPSVARAVQAFPSRLVGYTMIDPLAPDAAATAENALGEGGLRGVCLFPAMHRFHVFDDASRRIIEIARRHRGIVFCHFGVLSIPLRRRLGLPNVFDGTYAVPTDLHRVAADHPDVTFQIPHFGAGYFRETLLLGEQCPNVVVDTSSSNRWRRLTGHPLTIREVFRTTLDVFGPGRVLWGSDSSVFPRGWRRDLFDEQVNCLLHSGCSAEALRDVLGGNIRRLLGTRTW